MSDRKETFRSRLEAYLAKKMKMPAKNLELYKKDGFTEEQAMDIKKVTAGLQYTLLPQLVEAVEAPFEGGYQRLMGRINNPEWEESRPTAYSYLIRAMGKYYERENLDIQSQHDQAPPETNGDEQDGSVTGTIGTVSSTGIGKTLKVQDRGTKLNLYTRMEEGYDALGRLDSNANKGHLIPAGHTECAPIHSIYAAAVLGLDLDRLMTEVPGGPQTREKLVKLLQVATIGKEFDDETTTTLRDTKHAPNNRPIGLSEIPHNFLRVPKAGHEEYFDKQGSWMFVPITTLEDAAMYRRDQDMKYLVLAGRVPPNEDKEKFTEAKIKEFLKDNCATAESLFQSHLINNHLRDDRVSVHHASPEEIERGVGFLFDCTIGIADLVANGLPVPDRLSGTGEGALFPMDFERRDQNLRVTKKDEILKTKSELRETQTVLVPRLLEDVDLDKMQILCVTLKGMPQDYEGKPSRTPVNAHRLDEFAPKYEDEDGDKEGRYPHMPDPMLLGFKCAINWMMQMNQKPLPACPEEGEPRKDNSDVKPKVLRTPRPTDIPAVISFNPLATPAPGVVAVDSGIQDDVSEYSDLDDVDRASLDDVRLVLYPEGSVGLMSFHETDSYLDE